MPIFYFDSEVNGRRLDDEEGIEFDTVADARREAVEAICAMAGELEGDGAISAVFYVRERGQLVLKLEMALKSTLSMH